MTEDEPTAELPVSTVLTLVDGARQAAGSRSCIGSRKKRAAIEEAKRAAGEAQRTSPGPIDAEFTGASCGRRHAGDTVLTFMDTETGEDVAIQLGDGDLEDLYKMLHGWGVWCEFDADATLDAEVAHRP